MPRALVVPFLFCPFLICILVLLGACRSYRHDASAVQGTTGPAKESWDVHMYITEADPEEDHSVLRLELIADYAVWFEERDSTYQRLSGVDQPVHVVLYDSTGSVSADITADRVWYYRQTNQLIADGHVVVQSSSDRTLQTEWIQWEEEDRTIRSDRYVLITSPDERLEGLGLTATEDLSQYQIGRFTAEVTVDS